MPKLTNRGKATAAIIESEGCRVISWRVTSKNHYQFEYAAPDGRVSKLTSSGTPGDARTNRNERAIVRKFIKEARQ